MLKSDFMKLNLVKIVVAIFFISIFALRIYDLEADIPARGLVLYQPIDEGAYANMALYQYNYQTLYPKIENFPENSVVISSHVRVNIIQNLFIYISMLLLGDNYYGLRISSVICNFINFILIYFILKKCVRKYSSNSKLKENAISLIVILLYTIFDFIFLTSSRIVEPSVFRLLFVLLSIYVFEQFSESFRICFFLLGLLTCFAVFFCYVTNVFLVLAVIITLVSLLFFNGKKEFFSGSFFYFLGSIIGFIFSEIYYWKVWHISGIQNAFDSITGFSGNNLYTDIQSNHGVLTIILRFFASNSNLYNLPLLFIILLLLPLYLYHMWKNRELFLVFLISIYGAYFLQTLVSEDFIFRKYIIIYFVSLFIGFIGYLLLINQNINFDLLIDSKIYTLYILFLFTLITTILAYRLFLYDNGNTKDFNNIDKLVLLSFNILFFFVFIFYVFIYRSNGLKRNIKKIAIISIFTSICMNLHFDISKLVINRTHTEKDIMISLNEYNNEYVLSAFSLGYTLYNDIKPVDGKKELYAELLSKDTSYYFLAYENYNNDFIQEYNNQNYYQLSEIKKFYRSYQTDGLKYSKNIALYKNEK